MKILRTRQALQKWRSSLRPSQSLAFVPTMGALHEGHISLVRRAIKKADRVIVSIFVNPTQFGPNEDYERYPRTEKEDLAKLSQLSVDAVFIPKSPAEIYGGDSRVLPRAYLLRAMEAQVRAGHFEGVATVVLKLFQLVRPHWAFFGEKDYQQLQVIRALVKDFFLPIKIVAVPTVREKDGLAMSSRNRFLSAEERVQAAHLYRVLCAADSVEAGRRELEALGFRIDYLQCWSEDLKEERPGGHGRWLVAARMHQVRLIDNRQR